VTGDIHMVGMIATFAGQSLGLFSASIITAKHMRLTSDGGSNSDSDSANTKENKPKPED